MVLGRSNGVVRLTGFSDKKMSGVLFGPLKSGLYNGLVVWQGSTVPVLNCSAWLLSLIYIYMYILKSMKNESIPFLCFCATCFTAVAALQA